MAKSGTYRVRQIHRWLGLSIGIQLLLWTVGGLYFSWVDIDEVHGDDLHRPAPLVSGAASLASPAPALDAIRRDEPLDSLVDLSLASVLGRPTYRIAYFSHDASGRAARRTRMADALTGELRPRLSRDEAVALARRSFTGRGDIADVEYLDEVGSHHEFRGQPLPAWAVRFQHDARPTAYVAADLGEVIRIRNAKWRAYDFLWMLHTMDFQGRDDFNNTVLRWMSVLGLVTVVSGFLLFGLTSPRLRRAASGRRRG